MPSILAVLPEQYNYVQNIFGASLLSKKFEGDTAILFKDRLKMVICIVLWFGNKTRCDHNNETKEILWSDIFKLRPTSLPFVVNDRLGYVNLSPGL